MAKYLNYIQFLKFNFGLSFFFFFFSFGLIQFSVWRSKWQPTPVFLPGKFHEQRSLGSYIQSMGSQRVGHGWVTKHNVLLIVPSLSSYFLVCFVIFNYQLILHGTLPMVGTLLGMQSSFRVICVYFRFLLYQTGQLNSECRTAKTRASLLILRKLFFFPFHLVLHFWSRYVFLT